MFTGEGGESIKILGSPGGFDDDGYPLPGGDDVTVHGCMVQRNVTADDVSRDRDGATEDLRVFAPAGTSIARERHVMIRGERYRIVGIPFDWSSGRRPVFAAHRPRVEFTVTRGEG